MPDGMQELYMYSNEGVVYIGDIKIEDNSITMINE